MIAPKVNSTRMKNVIFAAMNSFRGLFFAILALFTSAAFLEGLGFADEILFAFLTLLMLSAVHVVQGRHGKKFFVVCAGLTIVMNAVAYLTPSLAFDGISLALNLIVFTYVTWLICEKVFSGTKVDSDLIYGAICVYLYLGIDCAIAYDAISLLDTHAFYTAPNVRISPDATTVETFMHTYVYFSFTTLTSVGYGDIVPVSSLARYTAVLEAIAGQVYLSVLVARLVGLHITARN